MKGAGRMRGGHPRTKPPPRPAARVRRERDVEYHWGGPGIAIVNGYFILLNMTGQDSVHEPIVVSLKDLANCLTSRYPPCPYIRVSNVLNSFHPIRNAQGSIRTLLSRYPYGKGSPI